MGEIEIMTDDDAKDVAQAIEKIINRKKIHISVEKARNIVATIKMMEFVGYDLNTHDSDMYANPGTVNYMSPVLGHHPNRPLFTKHPSSRIPKKK